MKKALKEKIYGNASELENFKILRCAEEDAMSTEEKIVFYKEMRERCVNAPFDSAEVAKYHASYISFMKKYKHLFDCLVKYKLVNSDMLPKGKGPYLYVANHSSNWDPPIVMRTAGEETPTHLMLKYELWGQLFGNFLSKIGIIFVDRRSDRSKINSLFELTKLLFHGHNGIIFPEGHRNPEPDEVILQNIKIGAPYIAKLTGATIVLLAITKNKKKRMRLVRAVGEIVPNDNMSLAAIKEEIKAKLTQGILDNRKEIANDNSFGKEKVFVK